MSADVDLPRVLRDARARAGLTQRQLAERMGVSWVTVCHAERGADVKHSTLVRYLEALPTLTPQELLPPGPDESDAVSQVTAWEHYRDLFGFEVALASKRTRIYPSGDAESLIETRGLKSHRGFERELRLLVGIHRVGLPGTSGKLSQIEAGEQEFTARMIERREGRTVHQFRFPGELARTGVTYRRRMFSPGLYRPSQGDGAEKLWNGVSIAVHYPVRLLRLFVHLPEEQGPADVASFVWPTVEVPDPDLPDLRGVLKPRPPPVRTRGPALRLEVPRPLVGLRYGLGWLSS